MHNSETETDGCAQFWRDRRREGREGDVTRPPKGEGDETAPQALVRTGGTQLTLSSTLTSRQNTHPHHRSRETQPADRTRSGRGTTAEVGRCSSRERASACRPSQSSCASGLHALPENFATSKGSQPLAHSPNGAGFVCQATARSASTPNCSAHIHAVSELKHQGAN